MSKRESRRHFLKLSGAAAVGCVVPGIIGCHGLRSEDTRSTDSRWTRLFDGETLKGWHKNPERIGHGTGGAWSVEDGAIVGEQDPPGSGNGGILLTDETFGDFELVLDMKPDWGVCSGLFVRGNDQGQCFQMMVDYHDAGNVGQIYGEGTTGFNTRTFDIDGVYDEDKNLVGIKTSKHNSAADVGLVHSCTPEEWIASWKLGDWNSARVRVEGEYPKITTWINGTRICEFDGAASTSASYRKAEILEKLGPKGRIAVQVHGGGGWPKGAKCRWRNIKIRTL